MADIPTRSIAQLPVASSVNGNDQLVISQGGITKSAIASQLRAITTTLSVTDDLYVGRDAFISGRTTTGTLRVIGAVSAASANFTGAAKIDGAITAGSTVSAVSDIYTNRDAFVSGKTTTGTLRVIGAVSASDVNINTLNGQTVSNYVTYEAGVCVTSEIGVLDTATIYDSAYRRIQNTIEWTFSLYIDAVPSGTANGYIQIDLPVSANTLGVGTLHITTGAEAGTCLTTGGASKKLRLYRYNGTCIARNATGTSCIASFYVGNISYRADP